MQIIIKTRKNLERNPAIIGKIIPEPMFMVDTEPTDKIGYFAVTKIKNFTTVTGDELLVITFYSMPTKRGAIKYLPELKHHPELNDAELDRESTDLTMYANVDADEALKKVLKQYYIEITF